jgi:hypothetical protein
LVGPKGEKISKLFPTSARRVSSLLSAILFSFQYDKSLLLSTIPLYMLASRARARRAFFPSALSLIEFNTQKPQPRRFQIKFPPATLCTKFLYVPPRNQISPFFAHSSFSLRTHTKYICINAAANVCVYYILHHLEVLSLFLLHFLQIETRGFHEFNFIINAAVVATSCANENLIE